MPEPPRARAGRKRERRAAVVRDPIRAGMGMRQTDDGAVTRPPAARQGPGV
ncbi:hypothetical protein [Sinomonas mesophila]|uniref:hypothetical protein n=1 Tax=Sinomonas mesophila TaxID=1531955 RepID=UPI00158A28E7|nr:hypothetical protein [Sinomonas mesophila]